MIYVHICVEVSRVVGTSHAAFKVIIEGEHFLHFPLTLQKGRPK